MTIVSLSTNTQFITDGGLTEAQGTAQAAPASDKNFGAGQALEVRYPSGVAEGEIFALGYFDDARRGLEAWADAVAKTACAMNV